MGPGQQELTQAFAEAALPRIVFVFGKGGVGRSTVAAALGLARARRERVLIVEWAVADCIGPWFGSASAGPVPAEIAPHLAVENFSIDEALRAYFVDHLHMGFLYRSVIHSRAVARMLAVAPGLAEMFFLGQLWWLITLAEREAGLVFDRIIVDAPATGHGASMLDVPATVAGMSVAGLLATETARVVGMMEDPARVGALVVTLPEPLVADETTALIERLTARLARPPLALIVNRSAAAIAGPAPWLPALAAPLSPSTRTAVAELHGELEARNEVERALRGTAPCPVLSLPELPGRSPLEIVRAVAEAFAEAR